ncbi:MAG TPA: hypothetical protein VH325_07605 [Bryobacteraceae bacterium]|jgi:hypothetical protein|nr:hypothetical protein [Bryobacteraceae bacterium]
MNHPEAEHKTNTLGYEARDANPRLTIVSMGILMAILLFSLFITIFIQRWLRVTTPLGEPASPLAPGRVLPPDPKLEVHPWETYPVVREDEDKILNSYGKDAQGHIHIPIAKAMDDVLPQLAIEQNAPVGLTTTPGQGRGFSGSVKDFPPGYTQPQQQQPGVGIKGEVTKHAQP